REEPFDSDEVAAILGAAEDELGWGAHGGKRSPWGARAVPLDDQVSAPPGFMESARVWVSATPWVPPKMGVRANGRVREGLTPPEQLENELRARGLGRAAVEWLDLEEVHFLAVRVPTSERGDGGPTRGGHRGFRLRLTFDEPVKGPLALGHSSHFGLGWFRPGA
ncbi:MAG TPA: type I-U CRISPR-associated protein Csb2, partial [Myxococcota bacterium]|nr:type I-U CRISPR-associated protein Csb2 [Myxococcota bacterium]